jgi:hypothetical protein
LDERSVLLAIVEKYVYHLFPGEAKRMDAHAHMVWNGAHPLQEFRVPFATMVGLWCEYFELQGITDYHAERLFRKLTLHDRLTGKSAPWPPLSDTHMYDKS